MFLGSSPLSNHIPTIHCSDQEKRNTEAVGGVRYLHQHRDEGMEVGPAVEFLDHPALEIRRHTHVGVPAGRRSGFGECGVPSKVMCKMSPFSDGQSKKHPKKIAVSNCLPTR